MGLCLCIGVLEIEVVLLAQLRSLDLLNEWHTKCAAVTKDHVSAAAILTIIHGANHNYSRIASMDRNSDDQTRCERTVQGQGEAKNENKQQNIKHNQPHMLRRSVCQIPPARGVGSTGNESRQWLGCTRTDKAHEDSDAAAGSPRSILQSATTTDCSQSCRQRCGIWHTEQYWMQGTREEERMHSGKQSQAREIHDAIASWQMGESAKEECR